MGPPFFFFCFDSIMAVRYSMERTAILVVEPELVNMVDAYQKCKPYIVRVMNLHEIDKAIRLVKGPRDFDPAIRRVWDRLLNSPAEIKQDESFIIAQNLSYGK